MASLCEGSLRAQICRQLRCGFHRLGSNIRNLPFAPEGRPARTARTIGASRRISGREQLSKVVIGSVGALQAVSSFGANLEGARYSTSPERSGVRCLIDLPGIDMAFSVVSRLWGDEVAVHTAAYIEYDWSLGKA